jgi:hypothetical protein
MKNHSFSEVNRRRREENAFENLYIYAKRAEIPEPKRAAERAARAIHGSGRSTDRPARPRATEEPEVPHRLDDRTKEQLYARAQELDVEGRSQMSKAELIEAIRKA